MIYNYIFYIFPNVIQYNTNECICTEKKKFHCEKYRHFNKQDYIHTYCSVGRVHKLRLAVCFITMVNGIRKTMIRYNIITRKVCLSFWLWRPRLLWVGREVLLCERLCCWPPSWVQGRQQVGSSECNIIGSSQVFTDELWKLNGLGRGREQWIHSSS